MSHKKRCKIVDAINLKAVIEDRQLQNGKSIKVVVFPKEWWEQLVAEVKKI